MGTAPLLLTFNVEFVGTLFSKVTITIAPSVRENDETTVTSLANVADAVEQTPLLGVTILPSVWIDVLIVESRPASVLSSAMLAKKAIISRTLLMMLSSSA